MSSITARGVTRSHELARFNEELRHDPGER